MVARIRGKDTKPEVLLRKALHAQGIRFRLHAANLPGRPDIVFPRFKAVCFVHGCFWHQHPGCRLATTPKTRPEFWQSKFESNAERDREVQDRLLSADWRIAVIWECATTDSNILALAEALKSWLHNGSTYFELDGKAPLA
jgi:DNA mismatch endonuclease, patch repair protein